MIFHHGMCHKEASMRLVVGYDQALAAQCYRRNLRQLVGSRSTITAGEIDYFAERMAETSIFSLSERLGNPWMLRENARDFLKIPVKSATRTQFQKFEWVANNLVILEGVVGRAGGFKPMTYEQGRVLLKRMEFAQTLYRKASHGQFYTAEQVTVLKSLSAHVPEWVKCLSLLPGNDYMDLWATSGSFQKVVLS